MLVDQIKERALLAMKEKNALARDILRLALGEIQTLEARASRPATDEEALAVVRKLIKSNQETAEASGEEARAVLAKENAVLSALLPASLSPEELAAALAPVREAIQQAKNDGQATGVAMKHLKAAGGTTATGNEVAAAVRLIRAG